MSLVLAERPPVTSHRDPAEKRRVADTLKSLRMAAGLTQEAVAHRIGMTLSGYRTYEGAKRTLRADQIQMFADAFSVAPAAITSRLWSGSDRSDDASELEAQLYALGYRPDEAPQVEKIARTLAGHPPDVRRRLLAHIAEMLDLIPQ